MGIDYYVHLGPYIKVHNPKRKTTETLKTCSNQSCEKHKQRNWGDDKFCKECGKEIRDLTFPCMAPLDFDVYEEFNDRLKEAMTEYKPKKYQDYQYFIGNVKGTPSKDIKVKGNDSEFELSAHSVVSDYEKFVQMYDKEISRLSEIFGRNNVTIMFGVLNWAS